MPTLEDYFPEIDVADKIKVLMDYALVQLKKAQVESTTSGGIIITDALSTDQACQEEFHETIGKVISVGPLFYRDKKDPSQFWPEGELVKVGDYVRLPEFVAGRFRIKDKTGYEIAFVHAKDIHISDVLSDPLWAIENVKTFTKVGSR